MRRIRVTVWNEHWDEQRFENVRALYPEGIHGTIARFLAKEPDLSVRTATFDDPDCGLSEEVLADTDVLLWWGHVIHHLVPDDAVERVCRRVLQGMGFIALHSALYAKPFERLVGRVANCAYRECGEKERVWVVNPAHEITSGLPACMELPHSEAYREPMGFPLPEELLFLSWYAGGEAAVSGGCYYRGSGRVFFFTPGHEDYPIYDDPQIQRVLARATRWACNPDVTRYQTGEVAPLEALDEALLWRVHKDRK